MDSEKYLYASAIELHEKLLEWWSRYDLLPWGFHGRVTADNRPVEDAPRGLILAARLLWTYADSYRVMKKEAYLNTAKRLYQYISETFIDSTYGGAYYSVTWDGKPEDTAKVTYANAFTVYALSAYYRITGNEDAYRQAFEVYEFLEKYAKDQAYGGYVEACNRDGSQASERIVTNENPAQIKTMNTSLHVLEAYTGLYRVKENQKVGKSLKEMLTLFTDCIINRDTMHQFLFFDRMWKPFDLRESFGHDIEASWLLCEAAEVLGERTEEVSTIAHRMVEATLRKGMSEDGLLLTEWDPEQGYKKGHYSWWEQNETVVGACQAWQLTGKEEFLKTAENTMRLINTVFWDREKGGYFPSVKMNLEPLENREKANMWTCPYHNARMCLELIERIGNQ